MRQFIVIPLTWAIFTSIGKLQNVVSARQQHQECSSEPTVADVIDRIYETLQADNADIGVHIAALKAALTRAALKEAVFDPVSSRTTTVRAGS